MYVPLFSPATKPPPPHPLFRRIKISNKFLIAVQTFFKAKATKSSS